MTKMFKEYILCSAINHNATIVTGYRHSDCYETIRQLIPGISDDDLPDRDMQGFLTSKNRFVDRKEAWKIAKENNQIKFGLKVSDKGEDSELISENLYMVDL